MVNDFFCFTMHSLYTGCWGSRMFQKFLESFLVEILLVMSKRFSDFSGTCRHCTCLGPAPSYPA